MVVGCNEAPPGGGSLHQSMKTRCRRGAGKIAVFSTSQNLAPAPQRGVKKIDPVVKKRRPWRSKKTYKLARSLPT